MGRFGVSVIMGNGARLYSADGSVVDEGGMGGVSKVLLLVLVTYGCGGLSVGRSRGVRVRGTFVLISRGSAALIAKCNCLFFGYEIMGRNVSAVILKGVPFSGSRVGRSHGSIAYCLVGKSSLPLFSRGLSFDTRGAAVCPGSSLVFALSLSSFMNAGSHSGFSDVSGLVDRVM